MARRPSNVPLFAGIGMILGLAAVLNFAQYQARPRTESELRDEAEMEARKNAPDQEAPPPAQTGPGNRLIEIGPDSRLGPPTADKVFTVGYHWTPEVQGDPMRVWGPIEMLEKMAKSNNVSLRLVNLDNPGAPNVPAGISFKGRLFVPLRPEGGFEPTAVQEAVPRMMMYLN